MLIKQIVKKNGEKLNWYGPDPELMEDTAIEAYLFFDALSYEAVRTWLWDLLVAAMESEQAADWDNRRCADHLRLYQLLCRLLQSNHRLYCEMLP